MKRESYRQIFEKCASIIYDENLSSVTRVIPYGQTHVTKLIVAFRDLWERT